jgi:hypothetical protein
MMLPLLLESAVRTLVLGAGVWGVLRLMRVRSPAEERTAWLCVLVAGSVMPLVATIVDWLSPVAVETASVIPALVLPPRTLALLWAGYATVAAVLLVRIVVGLVAIHMVWRGATPVPSLSTAGMPVRVSPRVTTPVAIGRGVLLPVDWPNWSAAKRAWVLAHERSHVEQHDVQWLLVARTYRAVFWMNPFAWWLVRRLSLLAEQISDDAALSADGRRADYAAVLLTFATSHRSPMPMVAFARRSDLSRRIERILGNERVVASGLRTRSAVFAAALAIALLSTATPWLQIAMNPERRTVLPSLAPLGALGRLPSLGE